MSRDERWAEAAERFREEERRRSGPADRRGPEAADPRGAGAEERRRPSVPDRRAGVVDEVWHASGEAARSGAIEEPTRAPEPRPAKLEPPLPSTPATAATVRNAPETPSIPEPSRAPVAAPRALPRAARADPRWIRHRPDRTQNFAALGAGLAVGLALGGAVFYLARLLLAREPLASARFAGDREA